MTIRALFRGTEEDAVAQLTDADAALAAAADGGWCWIDLNTSDGSTDLPTVVHSLGLDQLAVRDALEDSDVSKFNDFGDHLLVVVHGLGTPNEGGVATSEVDCFLTSTALVTVRSGPSRSIDALWLELERSHEIGRGGPDEVMARLMDVMTRRLLSVVDSLDDQLDEVIGRALEAHFGTVAEITALRGDLRELRHIARPQRAVVEALYRTHSDLVSQGGRRRFADVFDSSQRLVHELDNARNGLAEALDAYHGAEARRATEVTRVLTIYAAVMLPLSMIGSFFGMNFINMPGTEARWGWLAVLGGMAAFALLSLGMFVAAGWIRPLAPGRAGAVLGRGMVEASKAPAQVVGALYELAASPIRRSGPSNGNLHRKDARHDDTARDHDPERT